MDFDSRLGAAGVSWPFDAALATRNGTRFTVAVVSWRRPSAPARSTLLTAGTIDEASDILARLARRLRGRRLHGPLRGGDPTNLLTSWTAVPIPVALRGARPFGQLLAAGPLERRVAAATLLQQRDATTLRFAVEGVAEAFAVLAGVAAPTFRRGRAHRPAETGRHVGDRP